MNKISSFASRRLKNWPSPEQIAHYFLASPEQRWFFATGTDTARFDAEGVDGTEHLSPETGRADVSLVLSADPTFGVLLQWSKWDGHTKRTYYSRGDLRRLGQFVRNMHDTPLSVGLLVPFEAAWKAVKEFLETDGQLPRSIEWVDDRNLPPETFPDPRDPNVERRLVRG